MYDCEICGKKTESLYIIDVEGAELTTCKKCAEGKNIIEVIEDEKESRKTLEKSVNKENVVEVIENYGTVIRNAREGVGIPLKVLAELINEKESTLNRIEHGKLLPSDKVIEKLEKNLGIKLTIISEGAVHLNKQNKDEPVTLGDAAVKK